VKQQPEAYRKALDFWRASEKYAGAAADLAYFLRHEISENSVEWSVLAGLDHLPDCDWQGVPIILVDDFAGRRARFAPALIQNIERLEETTQFRRAITKLGGNTGQLWERTRQKLAHSVHVPGLDFKPWRKDRTDVFSVRVDKNLRAHLRLVPNEKRWVAEKIGRHDVMGHG
jgi:hypothetical protein